MIIQFNSAHHVNATEGLQAKISGLLTEKLARFNEQIAKLDVHFTDENGSKPGLNDKRCVLEAHIDGMQPIVTKNHGHNYEKAAEGAIDKLKAALVSALERSNKHQ